MEDCKGYKREFVSEPRNECGYTKVFIVHRLFPNSQFSIWIDAKLQLRVDPLLLIHSLVISDNVDMGYIKTPLLCSYHGRSNGICKVEEIVGCQRLEGANGDLL